MRDEEPLDPNTWVESSGPKPARFMFITDAPNRDDVRMLRPLAGGAGKVHDSFLKMATGLDRRECYLTCFSKMMLTDQQQRAGLSEDEQAPYAELLRDEIAAVKPTYLVPLGKYSASMLLGRKVRMDTVHGIAHETPFGLVLPATHPGSGLKDSKRLTYTFHDYQALAELMGGRRKAWKAQDETVLDYRLVDEVDFAFPWTKVSIDTEYDPRANNEPLMLTLTHTRGTGFAVMADDAVNLERVRAKLAEDRPMVVFHNILADLLPLKRMGIDIVAMKIPFQDTMVRAWYRESEPQGLKALAYRHLGVDRSGFEELVMPYYEEDMAVYLAAVEELTRPKLIPQIGKRGKPIKPKAEPMSGLHKIVRRFFSDRAKDKLTSALKRFENWDEEYHREIESLVGEPPSFSLRHVPPEIAIPYACSDTDDTLGIEEALPPRNAKLCDLDHRKIPMIAAMQERGIAMDMSKRDALLADLEADLATKLEVLRIVTERDDFNPNSADHIAESLFGIRQVAPGINELLKDKEYLLPTGWTKTKRPKTDKKALGTLKLDHELPSLLMEYKEVEKLKGTYVEPLPRYVRDGVLHPEFTHTRVPSGRLAARRPNIMAIPARTKLGKRVRELFIAREGFTFVNFDHSQIELRLAAEIAKDQIMLQFFYDGVDLHTATAAKISGRKIDDPFWLTEDGILLRALFKKINFGVLYGATAMRIYLELLADGIRTYTLADCEKMVQEWFGLYAGITREIADTATFLARNGYVEDISGRRRTLPGGMLYGTRWPFSFLREEAIRQGFNLKVQGGAQSVLIEAMVGFWEQDLPFMGEIGYNTYPLLQVHDELIFEVPEAEDARNVFVDLGLARMTAAQPRFKVPILSSSHTAATWAGLK